MVCSPAWHLRVGGLEFVLQTLAALHPLGPGLRARRRRRGSRSLPSPLMAAQWREAGAAGLAEVWCSELQLEADMWSHINGVRGLWDTV